MHYRRKTVDESCILQEIFERTFLIEVRTLSAYLPMYQALTCVRLIKHASYPVDPYDDYVSALAVRPFDAVGEHMVYSIASLSALCRIIVFQNGFSR